MVWCDWLVVIIIVIIVVIVVAIEEIAVAVKFQFCVVVKFHFVAVVVEFEAGDELVRVVVFYVVEDSGRHDSVGYLIVFAIYADELALGVEFEFYIAVEFYVVFIIIVVEIVAVVVKFHAYDLAVGEVGRYEVLRLGRHLLTLDNVVLVTADEVAFLVEIILFVVVEFYFITGLFAFDFYDIEVGEVGFYVAEYGCGDDSVGHLAWTAVYRHPFAVGVEFEFYAAVEVYVVVFFVVVVIVVFVVFHRYDFAVGKVGRDEVLRQLRHVVG